jgi:uncharacterized paraquat-inducible protein A
MNAGKHDPAQFWQAGDYHVALIIFTASVIPASLLITTLCLGAHFSRCPVARLSGDGSHRSWSMVDARRGDPR